MATSIIFCVNIKYMYTFSIYLLYFLFYSFLGWIHEFFFFLVTEKRFRNGGIVIAPLLPVYGIGAVSILLLLQPYVHNPFAIFVLSVILASVVEYIGHYAMEKWFHVLLWDYHDKKLNLHGRICLENSLGFGILALFLVYVAHPLVESFIGMIPHGFAIILAIVLGVLFMIDLANAWASMIKIRISSKGAATTLPDMKLALDDQIASLREHRKNFHKKLDTFFLVLLKQHRRTIKRFSKNFTNAKVLGSKKRGDKSVTSSKKNVK